MLNPMWVWIPILRLRGKFDDKNIRYVFGVGVLYVLWNCFVVLVLKQTVYTVINWVSIWSYVFLLAAAAVAYLGYFVAKNLAESKL